MNRLIRTIVFEDKDAWPLVVSRIILHDLGRSQPVDHIAYLDAVGGQFLVPVRGDSDFPARDEGPHLIQGVAQCPSRGGCESLTFR